MRTKSVFYAFHIGHKGAAAQRTKRDRPVALQADQKTITQSQRAPFRTGIGQRAKSTLPAFDDLPRFASLLSKLRIIIRDLLAAQAFAAHIAARYAGSAAP